MRKSILFCFLFLALFSEIATAQYESQQWEYFEINEYSSVSLNELGKKGWELIGFHQPEGQPIRFILKRPYLAERTRLEAGQKAKKEPQIDFVDIDLTNAQSEQKEKERKADEKINQLIRKIKGYSIISVKTNSWFPNANDRRVCAEIVIDASKDLLKDETKYRSSEAKTFIRQAALEIFKATELKPKYANQEPFQEYYSANEKGVNIKLTVVVKYNGETKILAEGAAQGDWLETHYLQ